MTTTAPAVTSRRAETPEPVHRRHFAVGTAGRVLVLAIATFLTLGPVIWTFWTSVTPEPPGGGEAEVGLGAYRDAFERVDMLLLFWNTILVTGLVAAGQMFTAALAGYVFARVEFRGKNLLFGVVLATMMVPMQVTIVPVFMIIRGMGLSDTLLALILPALPTAFGTFLMRQYFMSLPPELAEAAEIDGASPLPDLLLRLRSARPARPRDRRHPGLQLPLERVLPPADPDDQRGELHPAARARLAAGQPRHR
ncbi:carbohydrate ABC transporter permease [Micromonospora sp. AP08]|uniref:carbohydrate ABC transporter permease n=1 Tax=Micromonospora sp. AP08 TaxID=2604467 RepID=UPI001CA35957|nr:carbohydrate ABC transporter permease [Micromonospora sp. AP08]